MSVAVATGTQVCSISTEHTLATSTSAGSFVLVLDLAAAQSGDSFTIRVYRKVLNSGTLRLLFKWTVLGEDIASEAEDPIVQSVPFASPGTQISVTIEQTAGTGRSVDWSLESV